MIKKENKQKISEKEWKKLKGKIKIPKEKNKKETDEKSGLEEEIEQSEFEENRQQFFQADMQVREIPVTTLGRIEIPQNLEENVSSFPIISPISEPQNQNKENPVDYSLNQNYNPDNDRYQEVQQFEPPVLRPIRTNLGLLGLPQQEFIDLFQNQKMSSNNNSNERINFSFIEHERNLPFGTREDKKYKERKL